MSIHATKTIQQNFCFKEVANFYWISWCHSIKLHLQLQEVPYFWSNFEILSFHHSRLNTVSLQVEIQTDRQTDSNATFLENDHFKISKILVMFVKWGKKNIHCKVRNVTFPKACENLHLVTPILSKTKLSKPVAVFHQWQSDV